MLVACSLGMEADPPAAAPVATPAVVVPFPHPVRSIFYKPSEGATEAAREYVKMAYPPGAIVKDWREPTAVFEPLTRLGELPSLRGKVTLPALFGSVPIDKNPDDLLDPPELTREERRAASAARRNRSEEEVAADLRAKLQRDRDLQLRQITVKLGRQALDYVQGLEISVSALQLSLVNDAIKELYPDRALTSDEAVTWIFHERALTGDVLKHYRPHISEYKACASLPPNLCARAPCTSLHMAHAARVCLPHPSPTLFRGHRDVLGLVRFYMPPLT